MVSEIALNVGFLLMIPNDPKSMVSRYFAAVDAEDLDMILSLLTSDCVFRVETHGVELCGHDQITGMFRRLWANHRAVRHHSFLYVCEGARVSVQFQVENTELDGSVTRKSNCNFFDVEGAQFSRVSVYMAGENTLNG
jgi:ketosteroid isomerase-like protein